MQSHGPLLPKGRRLLAAHLPPLSPESCLSAASLIGLALVGKQLESSSIPTSRRRVGLFFPSSHLAAAYQAVLFLGKLHAVPAPSTPSTSSPNVLPPADVSQRRPTLRRPEAPTRPIDLAELWIASGIKRRSRACVSKA